MKRGWVVKLVGGFFMFSVLTGCHDYNDYNQPTSAYGTGTYHCYSQNVQTGQLYKAELLDKKKSILAAQRACLAGAQTKSTVCQEMDCVFR